MENILEKIDYKLLREQKADLLSIISDKNVSEKQMESLDGIIILIDNIQDYAVMELGISSKTVFNLK
jgi:hypothetical protein